MSDAAAARARTVSIGMTVFLGGWTMLFVALLFVWADVRVSSPVWPPDGEPRAPLVYPALATILIAASSWLLARGRIVATVIAGLGFIGLQLAGLWALWRLGVTPSSGRYGSLLYTFLALHGLHVVVGLGGLMVARGLPSWRRFWHFVGAVWIVLFCALYLAGCADEHTRGRVAYQQYCRPCHGDAGDGHGFSSLGLRPPPRDFTQALFEFGKTPAPMLPPDSELEHIIRHGLNGTAMRPWDVSDRELHDVVQYLKISPRWQTEKQGEPIVPTPDPYGSADEKDAIADGDGVFHRLCASCHDSHALRATDFCLRGKWDDCQLQAREVPPNLHCDPLRAIYADTEGCVDLYRTISAGIGGASVPPWRGALPEDEIWAVSHYVHALRRDQTGCSLSRTGQ